MKMFRSELDGIVVLVDSRLHKDVNIHVRNMYDIKFAQLELNHNIHLCTAH